MEHYIESRTSLALLDINKERIKYKQEVLSIQSKSNYVKKIISFAKNGDFKYILHKLSVSRNNENISNNNDGLVNDERDISIDEKLVIYTVMFGKYDMLNEPVYPTQNCEYYIVTDQSLPQNSQWKKIDLSLYDSYTQGMSNLEKARFFKTHPHVLFPEFRYSMFVDANVQPITDMRPVFAMLSNNFIAIHKQPGRDCVYEEANAVIALKKGNKQDVEKQIITYRKEGFPEHFGLFQTNVVVREHSNPSCIQLMDAWWSQMEKFTKRDQLSFTYCLWKLGYKASDVSLLGPSPMLNPRFRIEKHV